MISKFYIPRLLVKVNGLSLLISSSAGMRIILEIKTTLTEERIISIAKNAGINIWPVSQYYMVHSTYRQSESSKVMLSYKGISIEDIEPAIKALSDAWFKVEKDIL